MVEATRNQRQITSGVMNLEDWLKSVLDAREGLDINRLRAACELASQAEQKALETVGPWAEGRSSSLGSKWPISCCL